MQAVNDLLATVQDPAERSELERVRKLIAKQLPDAEQVVSYGMPSFKYHGKYLISYWVFKDHFGLYPGAEVLAEFKKELGDHATSKGTVQYTLKDPMSDDLLRKIIDFRAADIDGSRS